MDIKEFNLLIPNKRLVKWKIVESELGYKICDDVKSFFSRIFRGYIRETVYFKEDYFFRTTGNDKYDHWISFNGCEGEVEVSLNTPKNEENIEDFIIKAFRDWTGGNDFGHRVLLGDFGFNIGSILILLNNNSGQVEWMDCEYGYFDVYEENPNGVVANSLQEFFDKCIEKRKEIREAYIISKSKFPEHFIHDVFPSNGGLLPCAITDNGDEIYWLTSSVVDEWSIIVYESRSSDYFQYNMGIVEFLYKILTKEIKCSAFPDDF